MMATGLDIEDLFESQEGKVLCKTCNSKLKTETGAATHYLSVHLGVKYACDECDHRFTQTQSLQSHKRRMHRDKEVKEQCSHCGGMFRALQLHIKEIHGEIHKCTECAYETKRKSHLRDHIDFHHRGIYNYMCSQCDHKAIYARDLREHERKQHSLS